MPIPLSNTRRLELLEQQLASHQHLLTGLEGAVGRIARAAGKRWAYLAKTVRQPSEYGEYGEDDPPEYPTADGANTFGLRFLDREYTATEGAQTITDHERSAGVQAIGTTINGQWVMEEEAVLAIPAPPPPSTTGKGRWLILPIRTHYWGKIAYGSSLARRGSATVDVWRLRNGVWIESGFQQTVWDRLLLAGVELEAQTWLKFIWEPDDEAAGRWIVCAAGCDPDAEAEA